MTTTTGKANGWAPSWRWIVSVLAAAAVLGALSASWASYQRLERVDAAVQLLPEQTRLLRIICRSLAPDSASRLECGPTTRWEAP